MTEKEAHELRENAAKLIFKNSKNTIHTYSKTCSDASQFFTKSLILKLKQNLSKNNYYEENGSLKRDLSIETDYCILRAYYKKKRNMNLERISKRSKYSVNRTEIDTIGEFNDQSACGDSDNNFLSNANINVNLTSLVVNNLKQLLNDWVKKYLVENNETKEKVETVLDSIIHQLDVQKHDTPSSHTYTLDIEIDENIQKEESERCKQIHKHKTRRNTFKFSNYRYQNSTVTIPLNGKHLKLISTLSLPRYMHKIRRRKSSFTSNKKVQYKRILLSTKNSSFYILNSSNLNFLTLPTNFLMKHCTTYERHKYEELKTSANRGELHNDEIFNICKHMADVNRNSDVTSKIKSAQSMCSTENGKSDPLVAIDLIKSTDTSKNENVLQNVSNTSEVNRKKTLSKTRKNENSISKKISPKCRNYKFRKSKRYTYMFKNTNNYVQQEKELLQNFQSIFRYFSKCQEKHNIKLDINVNLSPTLVSKIYNSLSDISKETMTNQLKSKHTIEIANGNHLKHTSDNDNKRVMASSKQKIISLFDSAESQAKFIFNQETSNITESDSKKIPNIVKCNFNNSNVALEINELKMIVQSLGSITEKLVKKHMDKKMELEASEFKEKMSKSVQFSNNVPKSQLIIGLKSRKEPKKKTVGEFNPRLAKRSTSYNIIDSESILRVTDMTSATNLIETTTAIDESVTCSLPKSKSLFEISIGEEKKLLAFYCDDFVRPYPCQVLNNPSVPCRNTCHYVEPSHVILKYNEHNCCDVNCLNEPYETENDQSQLCNDDHSYQSCCVDIEKCDESVIKIRNRNGIGFWEGLLYCIFLWIPVLLVLWLFYVYVIEEIVNRSSSKDHSFWTNFHKFRTSDYISNSAKVSFNINDLGF